MYFFFINNKFKLTFHKIAYLYRVFGRMTKKFIYFINYLQWKKEELLILFTMCVLFMDGLLVYYKYRTHTTFIRYIMWWFDCVWCVRKISAAIKISCFLSFFFLYYFVYNFVSVCVCVDPTPETYKRDLPNGSQEWSYVL